MPSAARPFHLAALLLGVAFALPARAEEPRSQVQAPRLPVLFTACEASAPEAPVFVGRSNGLRAHFHRDRIELLREDERARAKVALRFVGAATTPESAELAPGKVNYLLGEPSQWHRNVALHAALRYRALWPGVDLVAHGRAGELQYDLHFAPGIDLEAVALRVEGASAVRVNEAGALVMSTPLGELVQQAPLTWEVRADDQREVVPSAFALREDGSYGFRVQRVDASRPLVVDPILVWGTYLGAAGGGESASAIHVDDSGAIYIAGTVAGVTGYETPGAYRTTTNAGPSDGFLAKLDPSQTGAAQVVWFTLMGGSQSDTIQAMVRRPSGTLVASGRTTINEGSTLNGLLTPNAYSTTGDCFLIELSADGSSVLYGTRCSFLANDLKLEPSGVLLIGMDVLQFSSPTAPTTPGAFQASKSGPDDIWLGRFDNRLSGSAQLLWGSYFGGSGSESLSHVMPSTTEPGVFTFAGITNDATTFPSTHSSGPLGSNDVFLARMDTNQVGSAQRRFAHVCGRRFLVGGESDLCGGFVEEPDGTIWLASVNEWSQLRHFSSDGATILELWDWTFTGGFGGFHGELFRSDDGILTMVALSDFIPVTPDAVQSTIRGRDLGVVQLDPVAHQVLYGTRLGSVNADGYTTGACHLRGNVLTLALTIYEGAMPILNPLQPAHSGGGCCNHTDLYLARLELPFGQSATPGIGPRDLALLDLDGDGRLDAATANETSNNLSLRTNEGLGVFSAETTLALTASDSAPVALACADLDDDGDRDDLAVACEASSTLVLVTNPGEASPTLVSRAVGGARASCVACGDLDADLRDDVVVGREGLPLAGGGGLALSLNGGALVSVSIPAPHPTQVVAVALGDLDGDGDTDLAAVARGASDALLLFAGDGAGALSFAAALPLSTSGSASGLVLADLDRDGRNDLAVAQPVLFPPSQSLRIYRRTSSGALSSGLFAVALDVATSGSFSTDLAVGDLEQDSIAGHFARLELAQADAGSGTVVLRGGFDGSGFASSTSPTVGTNPVAVAIGDLNGDGCDDLVVANQGSSDLSVVLTTTPALAQSYGAGCGGPLLSAVGLPTLGNASFGVQLSSARLLAPAIFFYGLSAASTPLPPSACSVLFADSLGSLLAFTNGTGSTTLGFAVPNDPFLRGADLFFQCAVFRSPGGAFSGTLDLSNGLRLQVGS